jgi:hypothetical protein
MSTRILQNGFRTLIAISGVTPLFQEVSVTPIGLQSDDAIEQTNMRNSNWRTFAGGALLTATEVNVKVHYAPSGWEQLRPLLRSNRFITLTMPDGATISFYAIVQSFVPDEHTINEQPTATLILIPSNLTTSNPPTEIGPIYATGTTTTVAP